MNIFQFLFYLGIINIIFSFLWKWVFVLPSAILFTAIKFDFGMYFVKLFGIYLMTSLMALLTLGALGETPSLLSMVVYPLVGAFVIFIGLASNQYEARKQAYQSNDYEMIRTIQKDAGFEVFALIGAVVFYIFVLFVPSVSANSLIVSLFSAIQWIYGIPIVGWLIGIGGVLFLLNTLYHGLFAFGAIVVGIVSVFKKKQAVEVIEADIEPKLE